VRKRGADREERERKREEERGGMRGGTSDRVMLTFCTIRTVTYFCFANKCPKMMDINFMEKVLNGCSLGCYEFF
jgi:hypothetical protein